MEKQKLVRLSDFNSIGFNDARQQLVDFVMCDQNTTFSMENLVELLPAVYSYCNHQFKEKGTHLPKIKYNAVSLGSNSTIAYVGYNELNINVDEFDTDLTTLTADQKLEILNVLFHEHTHLSDYNNNAIKTTHNIKTELKQPLRDDCFDYFNNKLKEYYTVNPDNNSDRAKNFIKVKNIFDNFLAVNYKYYYLSNEEARARNTAFEFTREVLDEATNQNINSSKQPLLNDLNQAFNDQLSDEREEDGHVRSFKLKPELKEFLERAREDMLGEFSSLVTSFKSEYKNDPDSTKTQILAQSIENLTDPLLVTLYGEMHDENIANDLLNSYIDLAKDNKYFELGNFSSLIGGTRLLPSKEQMLDIAHIFQNKPGVSSFTYNPLDSFVTAFHFHDTDELLEIFMIDNPEFAGQLEFYSGFLVDIDDKTKAKHEKSFDELQAKNKPRLRDKVKGGFEDLFGSMKKDKEQSDKDKVKGGFGDLFSSIKNKESNEHKDTNKTEKNPFSFEFKIDDDLSNDDTFGLE